MMIDETMISDPPSAFVIEWLPKVRALMETPACALDVAMGRGRHTLPLAHAGFNTFAVDIDPDLARDVVRKGKASGTTIHAWCADLRTCPLPQRRFDLIVVTRYLQRDLMASLREAVAPGGIIMYETFTVNQLALGKGPKSPDHLLEPGELSASFPGFDVVFEEEVLEPEAVARVVALRRSSGPP